METVVFRYASNGVLKISIQGQKDVKEHWKALNSLLNDEQTTEIVNACDAGREGES